MVFDDLARYAEIGLIIWLALLAGVVFQKLITDPGRLNGLFASEASGAGEADRIQLLMVAAVTIGGYLIQTVHAMHASAEPLRSLPEADPALLALMAGGQSIYLSGKLFRKLK
ncbi:hypothetical protein [Caulobacter sp. 1776]|uniref:hypothetical protein n=1 Tax=Caulobacter sp. 1776 TaxID=3156420 RepID=UPI00339300D9